MTQARLASALSQGFIQSHIPDIEVTASHLIGGRSALHSDLANHQVNYLRLKQNTQLSQHRHFNPLNHLSSPFPCIFYPQLFVLAGVGTLYFLSGAQRRETL